MGHRLGLTQRSRERGTRRGPGVCRKQEVNTTAAKGGRESRNLLKVQVGGCPRYLPHLPYSRGRCHNIGLEVTHASEACLLLGRRDDGSEEIDTPGPLGPFHGWARTTRLKAWSQIWAACVHPTVTTSIPSLIRSSLLALAPRCSSFPPPPRPLTPDGNQASESDHPRRMAAGENVYKTRTSHLS